MPVVLGAILPHHPHILMSNQHGRIPETVKGMNAIKEALLAAKPDILLLINSHPPMEEGVFLMNVHPEMTLDFSEYGYKAKFRTWNGNMELSSHLRLQAQETDIALQMTTEPFGMATSVPLAYFSDLPASTTALPVHISGKSPTDHEAFGKFLAQQAQDTDARIAIVCSAEFATGADKNDPETYRPESETFNDMANNAIKLLNPEPLMTMEEHIVSFSGSCGYEPLITFLSCVNGVAKAPEHLYQEHYQGTTFITALLEC